ncbi:MAG: hypothetical protein PVF05_12770 [Gemmatimonadales bacterium]|jgi:hypothetical protein
MAKRIKADNDTWTATLDASAPGPGRTVVFFCTSNGQRPWRVVRVDEDELPTADRLDALSSDELRALFERSESMNVSPS